MRAVATLFVLSGAITGALADCCDAHFDFTDGKWICADGTVATPCCGKAPCNAFCCDCGMSHIHIFNLDLKQNSDRVICIDCRFPASRKRDLPFIMERAEKIDSLFQSVDDDNSGDLDLGEYVAWVTDSLGGNGHPVTPALYQAYINHFNS